MTHKTLFTVSITAILLLAFQYPSYSGVYKWVDDDGQIHYSDQPNNPEAEKFTLRKNTTTKARPVNTDEQDANGTTEEEADTPDASETTEPKMVEVERSKKEKRKLCNEAKEDIATISSRGRMREINEKGEYIYLPEEQRQKRLSTARKKQKEYCR